MSDEAFFLLRIALMGGVISWAILRFRPPAPAPPDEEPEDEHLHI